MKVGIIGAGFAGVAAAQVAAKEGAEVTLFSAENVLPYFKPRLIELAFGHAHPDKIFMNPENWYGENGIDLRLNSKVTGFNRDFEVFLEGGLVERFNSLILAIGAGPMVPQFARDSFSKNTFSLWNYAESLNIKSRVKSGEHIAIIGGGIIGLEVALRAEDNGLDVTIIEKMPHLLSRNFGEKASRVIEAQLRKRNINLLLDNSVSAIEETDCGMTKIDFQNGESLLADFAILSIGTSYNISMAVEAGIKTDRRMLVNKHLQTSTKGIFAAGDIAQFSLPTPCSAKEALMQGRVAGYNAIANLSGKELKQYNLEQIPLRMKYEDFEIYSIGDLPETDNKLNILEFEALKVYRGCVYEHESLAGVQMVGSGKDFMKYQKELLDSQQKEAVDQ
jgi:NADH oxidase (H2O-forming)